MLMPKTIPPWLTLLIGIVFGGSTFGAAIYFYTKEVLQVDILEATISILQDDSEAIIEITKEFKEDIVKAETFKDKVKTYAKQKPKQAWNKPYPKFIRDELLSEIESARSEID